MMIFPRIPLIILLIVLAITLAVPDARAQRTLPEPIDGFLETGRIDDLLDLGIDPDSRDMRGRTVLIHAVESGEFRIVERVLAASADPNLTSPEGVSPLTAAVHLGREDLVNLLLVAGADPNMVSDGPAGPLSALSLAVDRGEFDIVHRLTQAGANGLYLAESGGANPLRLPEVRTAVDSRIRRGLAELRDNADSPDWHGEQWALHRAARDNMWFDAAAILDAAGGPAGSSAETPAPAQAGAPPNRPPSPLNAADSRGVTPLITAVGHGNASIVSLLLERGARIDRLDSDGRDAMCYAAAAGREDILNLLAASRTRAFAAASPMLETSPYYWAVVADHPQILKKLIALEYPLPSRGAEGMTLLMTAAWLSDTFAVRSLLPVVNDARRRDDEGRSALEWSAAAFERDRRTGRETGRPGLGARNYPVLRLLARRTKSPRRLQPLISPDADPAVIEAWSPGLNSAEASRWRLKNPSPVPMEAGDGDLTLYRILRDEEHLEPSGIIP